MNVHVGTLDKRTTLNVSVHGGSDPRWRADGRELYFISESGKLMAAELTGDDGMQLGRVRELFTSPGPGTTSPYLSNYVVTRDGSQFLFNVPAQQPGQSPITLTVNWPGRLTSDMP